MAKNTGVGYRRGAVTGRTQFRYPTVDWQKREERTGHFMERKSSEGPFKGVAKEPDGRDTKNSIGIDLSATFAQSGEIDVNLKGSGSPRLSCRGSS